MRRLFLTILEISGINALFRAINQSKAMILCYHGICDDDFKLLQGYDERHIPKSVFRKQLIYLKCKGYNFVSLSTLVDRLKAKRKVEKMVVLTFDDGFRNIVNNA